MKQITITNTQKDARWPKATINFPENLDELIQAYGEAGAWSMVEASFPVKFRQTDGSQDAADRILRGETGGSTRSPYLSLYNQFLEELSQDKAEKVCAAIELTGFSKTTFKNLLNSKIVKKAVREKFLNAITSIEEQSKKNKE